MSQTQEANLGGVVSVLCDLRLACTALLVVTEGIAGSPVWMLLLASGATPLSYFPLRRWATTGVRWAQTWWYPVLDTSMTLLILLAFGVQGSALPYAGASLALLALTAGGRGLVVSLAPTMALHVLALAQVLATSEELAVPTGGLLGRAMLLAACSFLGLRLRQLLFSHSELVEQVHDGELARAHTEERTRLAQEMHDSVSKTLHGVHMLSSVLARRLRQEGHPRAPEAARVTDALHEARLDARRLLGELRQATPEELGSEIRAMAKSWSEQNPSVRLTLTVPDQPIEVGVGARFEVLRSIGELLENIRRHSRATKASVEVCERHGWVDITVSDNGVGMPKPNLATLYDTAHYGLVGVTERLSRVHGRAVFTPVERGTTVQLSLPVSSHDKQGVGRS